MKIADITYYFQLYCDPLVLTRSISFVQLVQHNSSINLYI